LRPDPFIDRNKTKDLHKKIIKIQNKP